MVMKMLGRLFGTKNSREINRLKKISDRVNGFEPKFEAYSDLELKAVRAEFVNRLSAGETLKALLPEAFAVVREAGKRALGCGSSMFRWLARLRCMKAGSQR